MASPNMIFDDDAAPVRDCEPTQVRRTPRTPEEAAWAAAEMQNCAEGYTQFIVKWPDSQYANLARIRLSKMNGSAPLPMADITEPGQEADRIHYTEESEQPTMSATEDWGPLEPIKDDIEALRAFVNRDPGSPLARMARKRINQLRTEQRNTGIEYLRRRINAIQADPNVIDKPAQAGVEIRRMLDDGRLNINDLLNAVAVDHNFMHSRTMRELIDEGYVELDTLINAGIDRRFVWAIADNTSNVSFPAAADIDRINKVSTEVYFWGIPSSGKSCALGAIMSVAASGTVAKVMDMDNDCQGYGYMTRLAGLFRTDGTVGTLPGSTSIYTTYEMGFDLFDHKNRVHPITCVDLAGELVRCMYKNDAGEDLTNDEVAALDTVTRLLCDNRSRNRKMHFFVLEYGGEERVYEGLRQADYLNGALQYIRRTNIFSKDTDAIFIIITKVDKTGKVGAALVEELKAYIDANYRGFYNGLQRICEENEINGGVIERIPFSLGDVCFQNYCLFNPKPAAKVVEIMLNRSGCFKTGKIGKLGRIFRG